MSVIRKEVPTWAIDWVNKTFTLLNTPAYIDDIFLDWSIYTTFTLVDKTITLVDAPTVSLFVDYESTIAEIVVDSTITFWDIKNKVWNLLGQKSTSTNFSDSIVWDEINHIARQVLKGRVKNLLNANQIFRAGNLWFTESKVNVRVQAWGKLNTALLTWDIVALCDTTNLLTSWYVEIGGDTITYSWKIATELQWVLWQTVDHLVAEKVLQLYPMPLAMDKPSKVYKIVDWEEYEILLRDENNQSVYYEVLRSWTQILLKIVWLSQDDLVEVNYQAKYSDMWVDTDVNPLPENYWISVLAYIVAGWLAFEKALPTSERILTRGYWNLQNMYQDYTNTTQVIKQSIRPKHYRFNTLRR